MTPQLSSKDSNTKDAILSIQEQIRSLQEGTLTVAERDTNNTWSMNESVVDVLYASLKHRKQLNFEEERRVDGVRGIRQLPGSIVRSASYIGDNCVLMPSFINIGAYVGSNTMIDTWATVGSGAYIGNNVHISGGVGIGGILEPRQKMPVIIEDGCFIGSRCMITEGMHIGKNSVIAAGTILNPSIRIFDSRSGTAVEVAKGVIPPHSLVVSASYVAASGLSRPCAEIIKTLDEGTQDKTALNELLRNM